MDVKLFKDGKWYIINGNYVINKQFIKDLPVHWFTIYRQIKINGGKIGKFPYFNDKKSAERFKEWLEAQLLALSMISYDGIICAGDKFNYNRVFVNGILLQENVDYVFRNGSINFIGNIKPNIHDIVNIESHEIKNGNFIINWKPLAY